MRNGAIMKVLGCLFMVLVIVLSVYLLMDSGNSASIIAVYDSVKPDSSSGFNRQLQFLKEYTALTKDTTLAISAGLSPEDADSMANGNLDINDTGDGSTSTSLAYASSRTAEAWKEALQTAGANQANAAYYDAGDNGGYTITKIDGVHYLVEKQGGYWSNAKGASDVTIAGAGCYTFAVTTVVNNLNLTTYTVADMLNAEYGAGTITWDTATKKWAGGGKDIGERPNTPKLIENAGLNWKSYYGNDYTINTGADAAAIMTAEGFNDCLYIIYGHKKDVVSSGTDHWLVCCGVSTDRTGETYLHLLNNGARSTKVPVSQLAESGNVNKLFKISK